MSINILFKCLYRSALAVAITLPVAAHADYPERNIEMIVGYPAGGGTDVLARTLAPYIEKELGDGTSVIVINRPGGGGEIGFTAVADAEANGYTIGLLNVPSIINPMIERTPSYNLDSFTLLANVVTEPAAIVVPADSPFQTFEQYVDYIAENPGKVSVANSGLGGAMHTAMLRFLREASLTANHIPFAGAAPSRAALMGGHVMSSVMGVSEVGAEHNAGQLRILAVMSEERSPLVADVPTLRDLGYDLVAGSYRGLMAPDNLPVDIHQALSGAIERAVTSAEFHRVAEKRLLFVDYIPQEDLERLVQENYQTMSEIWQEQPWIK